MPEQKPGAPESAPTQPTPAAPELEVSFFIAPEPEVAPTPPEGGAPADKPKEQPGKGEQAPVADPKPEEPPPPEQPKPESVAPKLAGLMRREAETRKKEEALKAKEAEVAEREKKIASIKTPLDALMAHGYTYEQATDFILSGKKLTPELEAKSEIKDVRSQLAKIQADQARRESEAAAANVRVFQSQIQTHVGSKPDEYEYIRAYKAEETVFDVINAHFANTGELLGGSPEEAIRLAAEEVEKHLETQTSAALTTKKFQSKLAAPEAPKPAAPGPQAISGQPKAAPRTLSNSQAAAVPPRAVIEFTNRDEMISRLSKSVNLFDDE